MSWEAFWALTGMRQAGREGLLRKTPLLCIL